MDARPVILPAPAPRPRSGGSLGLYVHVPFCATKCPYCDFNTYARIEPLVPDYLTALTRELLAWGSLLDSPRVATVFFGGGTPSYLPAGALTRLMGAVRESFGVAPDAEVTAEANPDDCTEGRLASIRSAGVNRLSIGVQSLDDGLLGVLGRRHDASQALRAFELARRAGFASISLDLMFGLPGQTLAQWSTTFERALGLAPDHVSMYGLTVEPGTPFAADIEGGRLEAPDGDLAADMYEYAVDRMSRLGYRHYEISNWAKPGMESRHNLGYWRNDAWLGAGPGAHSYLGGYRFAGVRSPREYVRRAAALVPGDDLRSPGSGADGGGSRPWPAAVETMRAAGVVTSVEEIPRDLEMAETMMMGLRLDGGVDRDAFLDRFGVSLADAYGPEIRELGKLGLVEFDARGVRLTRRGRLLGNEVFQRFMLAPQPA